MVRFVVRLERLTVRSMMEVDPNTVPDIRTAELARHPHHIDGIRMHGVTLEEIERLEGFSFSPSAGYLRSLVE